MQEKQMLNKEEIKEVLLGIMDNIDLFCRENNIEYFLCYGTLIGALRHKGFIPWDDDIDIMMKRDDYERFCQLYSQTEHGHYHLMDKSVNKRWVKPFAKVYDDRTKIDPTWLQDSYPKVGVSVDVFPLDAVATDKDKRKVVKKQKNMKMLLDLRVSVPKPSETKLRYIIKRILYRFIVVLPVSFFVNRMEKLARACGDDNSQHMGNVAFPFDDEKEVMAIEIFNGSIEGEFEGRNYMIPKQYDAYLRHIFGDYMQLPPEEDRVNHQEKEASYWV